MKIKFLKLKSWLLAGVMGALGLSSCHCNKQLAEPEEPETPEVKDRGDVPCTAFTPPRVAVGPEAPVCV